MQTIRLSVGSRDAILDALTARIDQGGGGVMRLYAGSMPASPDLPPIGPLLATLSFSVPAFAPAIDGLAEGNPIDPGTAVLAGEVSWARISNGDGEVVADCTAGTDNAFIVLNNTEAFVGAPVIIRAIKLRAEAE